MDWMPSAVLGFHGFILTFLHGKKGFPLDQVTFIDQPLFGKKPPWEDASLVNGDQPYTCGGVMLAHMTELKAMPYNHCLRPF